MGIRDMPRFFARVAVLLWNKTLCCRFVVKDRETYFTSAQRSSIVWELMIRAKAADGERVGLDSGSDVGLSD